MTSDQNVSENLISSNLYLDQIVLTSFIRSKIDEDQSLDQNIKETYPVQSFIYIKFLSQKVKKNFRHRN
jgi:hypothetical protein